MAWYLNSIYKTFLDFLRISLSIEHSFDEFFITYLMILKFTKIVKMYTMPCIGYFPYIHHIHPNLFNKVHSNYISWPNCFKNRTLKKSRQCSSVLVKSIVDLSQLLWNESVRFGWFGRKKFGFWGYDRGLVCYTTTIQF